MPKLIGGQVIARELIRRAADATFQARAGGSDTDEIVMWFDTGNALEVPDDAASEPLFQAFEYVPTLLGGERALPNRVHETLRLMPATPYQTGVVSLQYARQGGTILARAEWRPALD